MPFDLVDILVGRYVCAVCWGYVMPTLVDHEIAPVCVAAQAGQCDGVGFVTRKYAERRLAESRLELQEVYRNYPDLFGPRPKRSEQQLMSELGF